MYLHRKQDTNIVDMRGKVWVDGKDSSILTDIKMYIF